MLKIAVLFAGAAFVLAAYAPDLLLSLQPRPVARAAVAPSEPTPAPAALSERLDPHEQRIAADAGGQYSVDAQIGAETVRMLVDTGATMVVISSRLADRLGLNREGARRWRVHTANGDAIATETTLPAVDLGAVYLPAVAALIADRSAGEVNLLGASFLKRLASVESRDGVLTLRQ